MMTYHAFGLKRGSFRSINPAYGSLGELWGKKNIGTKCTRRFCGFRGKWSLGSIMRALLGLSIFCYLLVFVIYDEVPARVENDRLARL